MGIILGDNPAGHCFVSRDLVPMNFFKKSWLCYWKCICQAKLFIEFVKKLLEIFSQYTECDQGTGDSVFWLGWYPTEGESSNFLACWETPKFRPLVGHPDLPFRTPLRRVLDLLTLMILKRVSESFLSNQYIYSM